MPHDEPTLNLESTDENNQEMIVGDEVGGDVIGGDKYAIGDIKDSEAIAIGAGARAEINHYTEIIVKLDTIEDLPPAPGEPPYKGLAYFTEADADIYYGRESLSQHVAARLGRQCFLAVIGASGSGKSSLLRAGIIPRLRSQNWLIHVITPGAQPLDALANSLGRDVNSLEFVPKLKQTMLGNSQALYLLGSKFASRAEAPRLLLAVDQFEEVFTQCRDEKERQAFVENLLTAANKQGSVTIMIGLRADFYDRCAQFEGLRELVSQQQEFIGPMKPKELVRIIAEPAKRGGWQFVEGLVEQIIEDAGQEPGRLPLLSHALRETWERRRGAAMTLAGYRAAGGVEGAIAKTAEDTLQRLEQQDSALVTIAQSVFLSLTELGEGAEDTRRIASLNDLEESNADKPLDDVLQTLVNARLITTGDGQVEVAHEALIRRWPRLRSWLADSRERLRFERQLAQDAQDWKELGRDIGALYRGARLQQAIELVEKDKIGLNGRSARFLGISREEAEKEVREKEAQHQRDLTQQRALATAQQMRTEEAEQATRTQRKQTRTAFIIGGVALILMVVAIGLGLSALKSQKDSKKNAENLHAELLAGQALAETAKAPQGRDSTLALLLAIESYTRTPSADVHGVLRTIIEENQPTLFTLPNATRWAKWNADESYLLTDSTNGNLMVWAREAYEEPFAILPDSSIYARWNAAGDRFMTWSLDGPVSIWDVSALHTGKPYLLLPKAATWAKWTPDGSRILTQHDDGWRVWDGLATESESPLYYFHPKFGAEWSQNGAYLLLFLEDGSVTKLDTTSLQPVWTMPGKAENANWNSTGSRVLINRGTGKNELWDTTIKLQKPLETLPASYWSQGWSNDGTRHLFRNIDNSGATANEHEIILLDAISGEELKILDKPATGAVWEEGGTQIMTFRTSNIIDLWDGYTGEFSTSLAIDGKRVWYWNTKERRRIDAIGQMIEGLDDSVYSFPILFELPEQISNASDSISWVGWNNNNRSYIITWDDTTATVWNNDGTQSLLRFDDVRGTGNNEKTPFIQSYNEDQQFLVASETNIKLYPAQPEEWLKLACQHIEYNLSWKAWRENFPEEKFYHRTCVNSPVHPSVADAVLLERLPGEITPYLRQWEHIDAETVAAVKQAVSSRIDAAVLTTLRLEEMPAAIQLIEYYEQSFEGNTVSAATLNALCWNGALFEQVNKVISFCDRAVNMEPGNANYIAGRGLARALTGEYKGAAEDFHFYEQWYWGSPDELDESDTTSFVCWLCGEPEVIKSLEAGKSPFDPEYMAWLRDDWIQYFYEE